MECRNKTMANQCDQCGKIIKDIRKENHDEVNVFCSSRCQNKFEKNQEQEEHRNYVVGQMKRTVDQLGKLLPLDEIRKNISSEISYGKLKKILSYLVEKKIISDFDRPF